jgi:fimbrial isopeptide formation D2 family protein/uncharacterized repeat protein (TIGR01451 family)
MMSSAYLFCSQLVRQGLVSLATVATLGIGTQIVLAEGSREMVIGSPDRPYTEWSPAVTAGIARKTLLKVYVEQNETVNLGSSVRNSANGNNDIVYRGPAGFSGSCNVNSPTGFGLIDTVAKESSGPQGVNSSGTLANSSGYIPCTFQAPATGIYEVEFRAPGTTGNPSPQSATSNTALLDASQIHAVAAWDITVRNPGNLVGTERNGRVFTNYVALNMGSNSRSLGSSFFIQTKDGYRYRADLTNADPFGFIFFANSRGFLDRTNNSTLYRSANAGTDNTLANFQGDIGAQRPDVPDTTTDITHLIFFNRPDLSTLTHLGIPTTAFVPPTPTNFRFVGAGGSSGNQTTVAAGGTFIFNTTAPGSYELIIDTNNDGVFNRFNDRVLQNPATPGSNYVTWDGRDANGIVLQPLSGNSPYNAQVSLRAGEYHFPMLDVESNPGGLVIEMENAPGAFPTGIGSATVYYNDDNYTTANNIAVSLNATGSQIAANPRNATGGVNSSTGAHRFSSGYGDFKGIDTWTYFSSAATLAPLIITNGNKPNVRAQKSVQFLSDLDGSNTLTVGDQVRYTITYTNLNPGTSDATNFTIQDVLPAQLTYVPGSATITSQTTGNTIALNPTYDGTASNSTLTNAGTLRLGDRVSITITATVNADNDGNAIANQAVATFSSPTAPTTFATVVSDGDAAGGTTQTPAPGGFVAQIDNSIESGNDPLVAGDDDPTLIRVTTSAPPRIVLSKRITAIKNKTGNIFITTIFNPASIPNDPNAGNSLWPTNYLQGGGVTDMTASPVDPVDSMTLFPGDEVEYTIYFLNAGGKTAQNSLLCDRIPEHQTFSSAAFNTTPPAAGGLSTGDRGIVVSHNNGTFAHTNSADGDRGQYYGPGETLPSVCGTGPNNTGAIIVNLGNLPRATGQGTPSDSYGYVRFRATVK